jgi:predicted nucleic acid-binding protein
MIVVDSSVWIANLRGQDTDPVRKLRDIEDGSEILVGDLILLEVLQGARDDSHARQIEQFLRQFEIVPMMNASLAVRAAGNCRLLRQKGITIRKTIDVIIGTFCIENRYFLLQHDKDFSPMAEYLGLRFP